MQLHYDVDQLKRHFGKALSIEELCADFGIKVENFLTMNAELMAKEDSSGVISTYSLRKTLDALIEHSFEARRETRVKVPTKHQSIYEMVTAVRTAIRHQTPVSLTHEEMFSISWFSNSGLKEIVKEYKESCQSVRRLTIQGPELKENIEKLLFSADEVISKLEEIAYVGKTGNVAE